MLKNLLLVGAGGFIGACARYCVNLLAARIIGASFPFGVLIANFGGSFLAGVILALPQELPSGARLFLYTGFLGAFTTFSAFSADTFTLFQSGAHLQALLNIILNVILSLGGCLFGYTIMKYFAGLYGW